MKKLLKYTITANNFLWRPSATTDTKVIHVITPTGEKVFKFSYAAGNAFEHFKGELFNGEELNPIFILTDLGVQRNESAYMDSEKAQKERVTMLTQKGLEFINSLY